MFNVLSSIVMIYPVALSTEGWEEPYRENTCNKWASANVNYDALDHEVSGDESARQSIQREISRAVREAMLERGHVLFLENDEVFGKIRKQLSQLDSCNDGFSKL